MNAEDNGGETDKDSETNTKGISSDENEISENKSEPIKPTDQIIKKGKRFVFNWEVNSDTLINIAQALFTIGILFIAVSQNIYVRDATEAAIRATNIADSTYKLSVKSAKASDSISRERFRIDTAVYNLQIKSLREQMVLMKEQFKIENRPFIICPTDEPVAVSCDDAGTVLKVVCRVVNIGKHPTKILYVRTVFMDINLGSSIASAIESFKDNIASAEIIYINPYVFNKPEQLQAIPRRPINRSSYLQGSNIALIVGYQISFQDLINGDKYQTEFFFSSRI